MILPDPKEMAARSAEAKESAFKSFMLQPVIRLLMSKLPQTEPEILETIMKEAFNSGFSSGSGFTAISMVEVVMKAEMKKS